MNIQDKIIQILAEIKEDGTLPAQINSETSILYDIGLDSLQLITFVLTVEDEFLIEIDFEGFDLDLFSSVQTFCDYIQELKQKSKT